MAGAAARILIVEDTPTQAELLRASLRDMGHEIRVAETGAGAIALASAWRPDAILMDIELPDFSGFEAMRRLRAEGVDTAIIVITAHGSVTYAVEAMREGAVDFLVKPFAKTRLTVTLGNALEKRALQSELREVKAQLHRDRFFGFVGSSAAMQAVYRTIESVAASRANVFLTGESGTGKELAAEAVHRASPRRAKPFVALNCGAIPRDLLESEIFGHVKGAFTGATDNRVGAAKAADGGTLFLDEIGEMPLDMQVKLLRFVQTGSFQPVGASRADRVDVRIVSATNRDPLAEVEAGRFREDLYYRLYVVPIELPPLRERDADVVLIARHFLAAFAKEEGKDFRGFAPEAEAALRAYSWPGNVRQLQNVVRNIVVLRQGELVTRDMLPVTLLRALGVTPVDVTVPDPPVAPAAAEGLAIEPLAVVEKRCILAALAHTNQDVPKAARLLGINPSTIYRRLQAWRAEG
jgi:two-component system repressor protein LuxO